MPFAYYQRLSSAQKRIYDASAAVADIKLPKIQPAQQAVSELEVALSKGKRPVVEKAATALVHCLCDMLEVGRPRVEVLAKRPRKAGSELHGLYTYGDDEVPLIQVWMKTAARREVVAFKSFLRTLLHELLHHLDFVYLHLKETFHTEGFYQRESSLVRQLLLNAPHKTPLGDVDLIVTEQKPERKSDRAVQMGLFD